MGKDWGIHYIAHNYGPASSITNCASTSSKRAIRHREDQTSPHYNEIKGNNVFKTPNLQLKHQKGKFETFMSNFNTLQANDVCDEAHS